MIICAWSGRTAATAGGPTCVWSKYHVIRGEPSCARRHQDGEFLGTGKRRVEGRKVKGGTKSANKYTQGRRASTPCGNGTGSMRAELSIEAACLIVVRGVGCKNSHMRRPKVRGRHSYRVAGTCVHAHMCISMDLLLSATGQEGSFSGWKHRLATVAVPHRGSRVGCSLGATWWLGMFHRSEGRKVWSEVEKPRDILERL